MYGVLFEKIVNWSTSDLKISPYLGSFSASKGTYFIRGGLKFKLRNKTNGWFKVTSGGREIKFTRICSINQALSYGNNMKR